MDQKVVFLKKEQVAKHTWRFYAKRPSSFSFIPGQYLQWHIPSLQSDVSRYFTLSLSPKDKDVISFTTNEGNSIFKQTLFALAAEEELIVSSPMGGFYLRDNETKDQVYLSSGIGITPFYAMITHASEKTLHSNLSLIAAFQTKEDVVFYEELERCARGNPHIRIIYTIQNPKEDWEGERGEISEKLIKKYIKNYTESTFSIVGSVSMVEQTEELLTEMGVGDIKVEEFLGY